MSTDHHFSYKGFTLHCDPIQRADGRFGAELVVGQGMGETVFEQRFPSLDHFATAPEAVQHARKVGERWIDDNG
jgi:hypothetical protein